MTTKTKTTTRKRKTTTDPFAGARWGVFTHYRGSMKFEAMFDTREEALDNAQSQAVYRRVVIPMWEAE